jgi:phage terminase large subunit-like protein
MAESVTKVRKRPTKAVTVDGWNFATPDWEQRLREGKVPVALDGRPYNHDRAERVIAILQRLVLADVPGQPTMEEACGPWFLSLAYAIAGGLQKDGIATIKDVLIEVPKKSSKALPLDMKVATPTGFSTIAELQPGDLVIDADGKPTRVLDKSVVFIGNRCFEVEFSTGEKVVADADHRWWVDSHEDRDGKGRARVGRGEPAWQFKTTAELARRVRYYDGPKYHINNHRTAVSPAIELPEADLPLDPYMLGVWLGDGNSDDVRLTLGEKDAEHIVGRMVANGVPVGYMVRDNPHGTARRVSLTDGGNYGFVRSRLVKLGVLSDKHIPQIYLRASRSQRLDLLRGLLDTDGTVGSEDVVFTSTKHRLATHVRELAASLGFKTFMAEHRAMIKGRDCGPAWTVKFTAYKEDGVFSLERQQAKLRDRPEKAARSSHRQIVAIREVLSVPTQCIKVESATEQFLIGETMLPTGNSTYSALLMLALMMASPRPRAEFLLVAPSHSIAEIAYRAIAGCIYADAELQELLQVREHLKTVEHRGSGCRLLIKSFAMDIATGTKPAAVLMDEAWLLSDDNAPRVVGQLRGGMAASPEGVFIQISTASDKPAAGYWKSEVEKARSVRDGEAKLEGYLPALWEFPRKIAEDEKQWSNPDHWHLVTPNLGRSVSLDWLKQSFEGAKLAGRDEVLRWASQHLNLHLVGHATGADNRWPGAFLWPACKRDGLAFEQILASSDTITAGIDGMDDLTSLTVLGRTSAGVWQAWSRSWVQPVALERRLSISGLLRDFERDGDLRIVDAGVDLVEICELVKKLHKTGKLVKVGIDPAGIGVEIAAALEGDGLPPDLVVGIKQGFALLGAWVSLERNLAEGKMVHGGQPLFDWAVSNCMRGDRGLITKAAAGVGKIDPAVALACAAQLMRDSPSNPNDVGWWVG